MIPTRVGALILTVTFVLAAFVFGYNVGWHANSCEMVRNNVQAFQTDPAYWGTAMRTVVESCERGE